MVYEGEKAQRAKEHFFKESTLVALREFALRETAFEVESRHVSEPAQDTEIGHFPTFPSALRRNHLNACWFYSRQTYQQPH